MVSHSELVEKYANGAKQGQGSRMFIEGKVIYSYGYHFPIAFRIGPGKYLLNINSYSSSTSKHQGYVKQELIHATVYEATTTEIKKAIANIGEPIIIEKEVMPCSQERALEILRKITHERGLKKFPMKKIQKLLLTKADKKAIEIQEQIMIENEI